MKYSFKSVITFFLIVLVLLTLIDVICKAGGYSIEMTYHNKHTLEPGQFSIPLGDMHLNLLKSLGIAVMLNFAHNIWNLINDLAYEKE